MHQDAPRGRGTTTIARTMPADRPPSLVTIPPRGPARGAVVIAHGGKSDSIAADSNLRTPALRMFPFLLDLARAACGRGLAVAQLRYRVVGFNDGDPVEDLRWAVGEMRGRFGAPVCLVGHSMGARAALLVGGDPGIAGVAALAAWCPPGEPVEHLRGRTVLMAHGARDRITDPARSLAFARRAQAAGARVARFEVARTGHAMLGRLGEWQSLTRRFVLWTLGIQPADAGLEAAFALPPDSATRVPL
jgi:alpha-beta hydrolase superfamily lysophospholipase